MSTGIYIKCFKGFGNKVFDFISALHLRKEYPNTEIFFAIDKSVYDTDEDPFFGQIFPKISAESIIKFMFMNKYKKLETDLPITETYIDKLTDLPKAITENIRFTGLHKFAYTMYTALNTTDKQLFAINSKLISKKIEDASNAEYACVHVRYGDKLCHSKDIDSNPYLKYPVYTPKYYELQIKNLLDAGVPMIYIMTDTIDLTNEYIMSKFTDNKKVRLMESGFVESFYLMTKAEYIILSYSTFSFAAAYINEMAICHIVKKVINDEKNDYIYEDDALDPNWILINEPRFILNMDQDLVNEMLSKTITCQKYLTQ